MHNGNGAFTRPLTDFGNLPDYTPVRIAEVELITGMNRATINKRVDGGTFPKPHRDEGGRFVWSLGDIKTYCKRLTGGE